MGEHAKTAALWGTVTVVMLITCWIAFVSAPPFFSSYVIPADGYAEQESKIDLNTATAEELCALPLAEEELVYRLILERDRRPNGFTSLEELKAVEGVTAEHLAIWEDLLYCG